MLFYELISMKSNIILFDKFFHFTKILVQLEIFTLGRLKETL
jgi:hypothetical protein